MQDIDRLCVELESTPIDRSHNVTTLLTQITNLNDEKQFCNVLRKLTEFFISEESPVRQWKKEGKELTDSELGYAQWFHSSASHFKRKITELLVSEDMSPALKIILFKTILKVVCTENIGEFNNELFRNALCALLASSESSEVLEVLITDYGALADVRYFTLQGIVVCCQNSQTKQPLPQNIIKLLMGLPRNLEACQKDDQGNFESLTCASEVGFVVPALTGYPQQRKRKRLNQSSTITKGAKWLNHKDHQKQFSLAWKYFLCFEPPPDILIQVLEAIPLHVIPFLSSPLALSDFLTSALDNGGFIGLLALHGIFLLMTEHNLEYPAFYKRVYGLLDQQVFTWKQRSKFFRMLNTFLKTELIPAYTVASFIKKFARLALQNSPSGALICITFIHNLIRRHPACYVLLHKQPSTRDVRDWQTFDCFDAGAEDPSQSRAIESSLWEMEALGNHWCPQVATHAEILLKDLTQRIDTAEESLHLPLRASYQSLINECLQQDYKELIIKPKSKFLDTSLSAWDLF